MYAIRSYYAQPFLKSALPIADDVQQLRRRRLHELPLAPLRGQLQRPLQRRLCGGVLALIVVRGRLGEGDFVLALGAGLVV